MDFEGQIESLLSVQPLHDARIKALIRVAELQRSNLERLDEEMRETRENQRAMSKDLDERIRALVSAIGELVRRGG